MQNAGGYKEGGTLSPMNLKKDDAVVISASYSFTKGTLQIRGSTWPGRLTSTR